MAIVMNLLTAVQKRHSVRSYRDIPLSDNHAAALNRLITVYNAESGLNMQLVLNEPQAFGDFRGRYGKFSNVKNYIALIGQKGSELSERCGYFGEKLVLDAQMMGLNTCWVGGTYKKIPSVMNIGKDEKLIAVIAVGYGENSGVERKSKEFDAVSKVKGEIPDWFTKGVEAALLAPTALNQQKFVFKLLDNGKVKARTGFGPFTQTDLGIVKCHFEIGSGKDETIWG